MTMMRSAPWAGVEKASLCQADLMSLLAGEIAFIRVGGFLGAPWCADRSRHFMRSRPSIFESRTYNGNTTLVLGTLFGHDNEYFSKSDRLSERIRDFWRGGENPSEKLRQCLERALGWRAVEAREGPQPYLSSVILGSSPGTFGPLHCDKLIESASNFIYRFSLLLSWNAYFSAPSSGGELVIHRKRYRPEDDAFLAEKRAPTALVNDFERVVLRVKAGDLVIFDPGHYHQILKVDGAEPRISAHSFIGVEPARKEFSFWV